MTQSEGDSTRVRGSSKSKEKIPDRYTASVVIIEGHAQGMEYPISKTYTVIGRDSSADITIKDPLVSRQHAAIMYEDGIFSLKDLESTNGTLFNGKMIQAVRLRNRDKFMLGDTILQFILVDSSSARKVFEIG